MANERVFLWLGFAVEAGYSQQVAAHYLLCRSSPVFCHHGRNFYLHKPGGKSHADSIYDGHGRNHGRVDRLPPSLEEVYGSDIKKMYRANGVPLYLGLVSMAISAFLHLSMMSVIICVAAPFAFDAALPASLPQYACSLAVLIAVSLSIGSVLGLAVRNQARLTMISQLFFLPSIMLSGILFPIDLLPRFFEMLGKLFPAAWGYALMVGEGFSFATLWPLAALFAAAGVILMALLKRLQAEG